MLDPSASAGADAGKAVSRWRLNCKRSGSNGKLKAGLPTSFRAKRFHTRSPAMKAVSRRKQLVAH